MNYLIFHPLCTLLGLLPRTTYNFMHIATVNCALLHVNVSTTYCQWCTTVKHENKDSSIIRGTELLSRS